MFLVDLLRDQFKEYVPTGEYRMFKLEQTSKWLRSHHFAYAFQWNCFLHILLSEGKEYAPANYDEAHLKKDFTKQYNCELCPASSTHRSFLRQHRNVHTGDRPFACEYCPKRFLRSNALERHKLAVHSHEKDEQEKLKSTSPRCPYCQKLFMYQSDLNRHLPVHMRKMKHQCVYCGKLH